MAAEPTVGRDPRTEHHARRPVVPSLMPAVATTRGRRERNQDRVCALRTLVGGEPAVLLAVADGIGGLAAGEQAAELALQVVSLYAHDVIPETQVAPQPLRRCLEDLLRTASRRIWLWARDNAVGGASPRRPRPGARLGRQRQRGRGRGRDAQAPSPAGLTSCRTPS